MRIARVNSGCRILWLLYTFEYTRDIVVDRPIKHLQLGKALPGLSVISLVVTQSEVNIDYLLIRVLIDLRSRLTLSSIHFLMNIGANPRLLRCESISRAIAHNSPQAVFLLLQYKYTCNELQTLIGQTKRRSHQIRGMLYQKLYNT